MTLYDELELRSDCSFEEIKHQYRILAQHHHPDKGGDIEKFKRIKFAYEVLSDPERRRQYDTDKTTNVGISVQQEAINILANIFFSVIPRFDCLNGNLIDALKNEVTNNKTTSQANSMMNESFIGNLEVVKNKLKIKNPNSDNIILGFIEKQLENRYNDRKTFQRQIELADEMFLILDNYTYGFLELINPENNLG